MGVPVFKAMLHGLSIHLSTPVDYTHVKQILSFVAFSWFFATDQIHWSITPKDNVTANFTILEQEHENLQVIFHHPGIYILTASNSFSFFQRNINIKPCLPPIIKLMSSSNLFVLRSSDVQLQVKVERCSFYSLQHHWSIYNKSDGSIVNIKSWETCNSTHAHLPARSLLAGSYIIKYTACYIETNQKENIFINLKVFSSQPKAIISGGNEKLTSFQDWIYLVGNSSYDPDYTNRSLNFNWKCKLFISKKRLKICPLKLPSQANICFSPESLEAKGNYVFSLTVSNDKYTSLPVYQNVITQFGLVPQVSVYCISCKDSYFFCSAQTLRFKSSCFGFGCYNNYRWEILRNDSMVVKLNNLTSSTGNRSKTLVLKQGVLKQKYSYEITLKVGQHVIGYSTLKISPLPLPSLIYCSLTSTNSRFVFSLYDTVQVKCKLMNPNDSSYLHITLSTFDSDDVYTIYYGPKKTVSFRLSTFNKAIEKLEIRIYLVNEHKSLRKSETSFRLLVFTKNFSNVSIDFLELLETYINQCKKSADHSSILTDLICFCLKLNNGLSTNFPSDHVDERFPNKPLQFTSSNQLDEIESIHKNATITILSYLLDFLIVDQWSKLQQASFLIKLLSNNQMSFSIEDKSTFNLLTLFERLVNGYKNYSQIELRGSDKIPYYLMETSNNLWNILLKNYEETNSTKIKYELEKYIETLERITTELIITTQKHKVPNEDVSIIKFQNIFSAANKYEKFQSKLSYEEVEIYFNGKTKSFISDEIYQGFCMFNKYLRKSTTYEVLFSPFLVDNQQNRNNVPNKIETTTVFKFSSTNSNFNDKHHLTLESLKQKKITFEVKYFSFAIEFQFSGNNISVDLNITINDWTQLLYIDSCQPLFIFRQLNSPSLVEVSLKNRDENRTKATLELFAFNCTLLHNYGNSTNKKSFISNNIANHEVCKVINATINSLTCTCDELVPMIAVKQSFYARIDTIEFLPEKYGLFNFSVIGFLLFFLCGYIISWILFLNSQKATLYICGRWNRFVYKVTFLTSRKRGSGTTSNVGVKLIGEHFNSENTHINIDNAFKTDSCFSVLIACEKDLGTLKNVEVWHDNSGGSWTLSMVIVEKINELEEDIGNEKHTSSHLETVDKIETMQKSFVNEKNNNKREEEKLFYFFAEAKLKNNNIFVKLRPASNIGWWRRWCLEYRYQMNEKHAWWSIMHSQHYNLVHPAHFNFLHSYTIFISFIAIHSIYSNFLEKNYFLYSFITSLFFWLLFNVLWQVSFLVVERTPRRDDKEIYQKLKHSIENIITTSKAEKTCSKTKKVLQLKLENKKKSMSILSIITLLEIVIQVISYICINKWTLSIERTTFTVLFNIAMLALMEYAKIICVCLFKMMSPASSSPIHLLHQSVQQDEITLHFSTKVIKISPLKGYALEKSIKKSKKLKSTKRAFNNIILFSIFISLFVPFIILEIRDKHIKTVLRHSLNEILLFSDREAIEKEGLWWWLYAVSRNVNENNIVTKIYRNCSNEPDNDYSQRKRHFNNSLPNKNAPNYETSEMYDRKNKLKEKINDMENNTQCINVYSDTKNQSGPLYVFQDIFFTQSRSIPVSCAKGMYPNELCLSTPSWERDVACCGLGWTGCDGLATHDDDDLLVTDPWCYTPHKNKGYQAQIPSEDTSSAILMLRHLQDNHWIDHRSRSLRFEVQIYSLNADMFIEATSNIILHVTGGLTFKSQIQVLKVYSAYSFRAAIDIFLCMLMCGVSFFIVKNNSTSKNFSCKIIFVLTIVLLLMEIFIVFLNYMTYHMFFESYPRSINISKILLLKKISLYPMIGIGLTFLVKVLKTLSKTRTFSKIPNERLLMKLLPLFLTSLAVVTLASSYMFLSYNVYRSDFKSWLDSLTSTLKMMLLTSHETMDPLTAYQSFSIVIANIFLKVSMLIIFAFSFSIILQELVRKRNFNLGNHENTNILSLFKDGFKLLFLSKKKNNKELFRRVHFEDDEAVTKNVEDEENVIEISKSETNYGYEEEDEIKDGIHRNTHDTVCETNDCTEVIHPNNLDESTFIGLCNEQTGYDTICRNWLEKTNVFFDNDPESHRKIINERESNSELDTTFNEETDYESLFDTENHDETSDRSSDEPFVEIFEGLEVVENKIKELLDP